MKIRNGALSGVLAWWPALVSAGTATAEDADGEPVRPEPIDAKARHCMHCVSAGNCFLTLLAVVSAPRCEIACVIPNCCESSRKANSSLTRIGRVITGLQLSGFGADITACLKCGNFFKSIATSLSSRTRSNLLSMVCHPRELRRMQRSHVIRVFRLTAQN